MDMDFPHPRHAARTELQKADYVLLIASATSRQATSRTVSALLSAPCERVDKTDIMGSRIAFFAKPDRNNTTLARGAFWMNEPETAKNDRNSIMPNTFELPINLDDSTYGNSIQLLTVKPEIQVTERGTEL